MENSNLTQPTNKEITLSSKDIKKKPNFIKLFTLLMLPILVFSIGLFAFYFFLKANITYIDNNIVNTALNNSITKEEAEAKNLEQQVKRLDGFHSIQKSFLLTDKYSPKGPFSSFSRLSLEVDSNGEIKSKDIKVDGVNSYTEVFFLTPETIENLNIDSETLAEDILGYISQNNIRSFALDVSFTFIPGYMDLLEIISSSIKDSFVSVYLYPKWGDEVDYSHFATITNEFHKTMDLEKISQLVSIINVMSYNYTGPLDILPGPITPAWWFERTIQYYIKSGVPREKLKFGINTNAYEWPKREIELNPILNYSLLSQEALEIPSTVFQEFISENSINPTQINGIQEDIYRYTKNSVEYITIMPTEKQITQLERVASYYHIEGIYYK